MMEKNVFKFGESSIAFILPKKWADKEGLKPKGSVIITEGKDGTLIISTRHIKINNAERMVDANLNPLFITRWIGLHYMYGTTQLILHAKEKFTQKQLEAIEDKLNNDCAGFEIIEQSEKKLCIEDFTNIKEVELKKIYSRIKFMIDQEFKEILENKIFMLERLEKQVNRFYTLGIRYVNIIQPSNFLGHISVLNLLEQISDYILEIDTSIYIKNNKIVKMIYEQFILSFDAFDGDEDAIIKVGQMRLEIGKQIKLARIDRFYGRLLLNISDNIAGIGEYGFKAEKEDIDYS